MSGFCGDCGAPRKGAGIFCEQCGSPLKPGAVTDGPIEPPLGELPPRPQTPPSESRPARGRALNQRVLIGIAAGVLTLGMAAGGSWWWLAPHPATEAQLREGAQPWLTGDGLRSLNRPCLSNFNYNASPVAIDPNNEQTRAWLDALVKAGLYEGPEMVNTGVSWQPLQLRYTKTAKAANVIVDGRLCAASRLEILGVDLQPKSEEHWGPMRIQQATLKVRWEDRAAWSDNEPFKSEFDPKFDDRSETLSWVEQHSAWRLMTPVEVSAWYRARSHSQGSDADKGWLQNLFASGDTPEKVAETMLRAMMEKDLDTMAKLTYSRELSPEQIKRQLQPLADKSKDDKHDVDYVLVTRLSGDESRTKMELTVRMKNGETQFMPMELRSLDHQWRVVLGL